MYNEPAAAKSQLALLGASQRKYHGCAVVRFVPQGVAQAARQSWKLPSMNAGAWKAASTASSRSTGLRNMAMSRAYRCCHAMQREKLDRSARAIATVAAQAGKLQENHLFLIFSAYTGEYFTLYCFQKEARISSDDASLAYEEEASASDSEWSITSTTRLIKRHAQRDHSAAQQRAVKWAVGL